MDSKSAAARIAPESLTLPATRSVDITSSMNLTPPDGGEAESVPSVD
ncbi:hypothetical protein ACX3PH_09665 [Homoserinimonas sp. A520]